MIGRSNIKNGNPTKKSRFYAIPTKILTQFFTDLETTIINFIRKNKKSRIAKQYSTFRTITVSDFKIYYRATVIKQLGIVIKQRG